MAKSEIYICQQDGWHNGFGATDDVLVKGMRLTLTDTKYVGGTEFYQFKERPKGNWYWSAGFAPLRNYN